jgi:CheY-like chemotaxis protein
LSITVSLIHMHGGEIFLDSEAGVGSNFTFTLPLAEGEPTEPVGAPPQGYGVETRSTVLVVEDEPEVADLLRLTLESDGHEVIATRSGEEALRLAREKHPDMISLDIRLPDLSGFEVLELLKRDAETADIPVVIISVVADSERGLKLGAIDYLTKPLDVDRLLEVIDRVMSDRGTILVAEDDPETLKMLREALRGEHLSVRTTPRGDQALQLAQAMHPALVLLDLKMPGMDGTTVLKELRQNPRTREIPVIVMTGTVEPGEDVPPEIQQEGVVRFLTKPFSMDDLADQISKLVSGNGKAVPDA